MQPLATAAAGVRGFLSRWSIMAVTSKSHLELLIAPLLPSFPRTGRRYYYNYVAETSEGRIHSAAIICAPTNPRAGCREPGPLFTKLNP